MEHFRLAWSDEVHGAGPLRAAAFWIRAVRGLIRTAAVQRFGVERTTDQQRGMGGETMRSDILITEVRLALRALRRRPGTSFVAVVTLALGIGANTAIFSLLSSVLGSPLPYPEADRLVRVYGSRRDRPGEFERMHLTNPATNELRDRVRSLDGVAVLANYAPEWVDATGATSPERIRLLRVSADYFGVLGARFLLGSAFARSDEHVDSRAIVVREGIWRSYLGGAREAVGRTLTLDGRPWTVVGVVEDAFADPVEGHVDVWAPADLSGVQAGSWDNSYLSVFARLAPGADLDALRTELGVVAAGHDEIGEDAAEKGYAVQPLREDLVGSVRTILDALMGAVLFLLVLTCVNVVSVLLAAAARRERELAIRTSVGSSRAALVRLFLFEAMTLAAAAGGLGLALGWVAVEALRAVAPPTLPRLDEVGLGPGSVGFAAAATVGVGVLLGLATSLPFTRPRVTTLLGRLGGASPSPSSRRVRSGLVAVEVALATVLLVGAGILLRTVQELRARDLGADPSGVLTFQVGLPPARYGDPGAELAFHEELERRVASIPGVVGVAATTRLPVTGSYNTWGTRPASAPGEADDQENIQVNQRWVLGDFFRTAGLQLVSGRVFGSADDAASPRVVVVNQALVRRLFPDEDPVGRLLNVSGRFPRIVGVVEDEALTVRGQGAPMAYHSLRQWSIGGRTLTTMARTTGAPAELVGPIRHELAAVDPALVLFRPAPMDEVVGAGMARERFAATLLACFGGLAVLLAGLGLYGVLAQLVGRQRHEIGVRMALGADPAGVRWMVVGRGIRLALLGVAAGLAAAAGLTRLLGSMLYGVGTHDPLVFGVVPLLLVGTALASSYLPARRATRMDPTESLRGE